MPRIRTVKPEFWGDEKLAPMCAIDRLVFLGLLSFADDAGRLVDNLKSIDGFIFPETSETSRESLDRLAANGRIVRYESESGQRLIQIANWKKHQKIDHPSKYVLPAPPRRVSREPRESVGETLANVSRSDRGPVPVPVPTTSTSTNDRRPSTGSAEFDRLHARLTDPVDRSALVTLLNRVPHEAAWIAEMHASLDGMSGHVPLTPSELGEALRDYVANGKAESPNMRHFRAYLARTKAHASTPAAAEKTGGKRAKWEEEFLTEDRS